MRVVKRNYFDSEGNFIIRPYMLKDLAEVYHVSAKTVRRWINKLIPEVGPKHAKYFTVNEVSKIVNAIGLPQKIETKKAA
jgi:transcription initiation factor TFIIIB Brf1 subunit/transcription initiation factor TFIIB